MSRAQMATGLQACPLTCRQKGLHLPLAFSCTPLKKVSKILKYSQKKLLHSRMQQITMKDCFESH